MFSELMDALKNTATYKILFTSKVHCKIAYGKDKGSSVCGH